ncbi:MAG: hypothetical protein HY873_01840 [Chloroflexi bacterium]|nr:hypothetical protein [Chloroflexota bacterium]
MNAPTLRWLRDVAIAIVVMTAGLIALGTITNQAYAGLPLADSGPRSPSTQAATEESPHGAQPVCASCHRGHTAPEGSLLLAGSAGIAVCTRCHNAWGEDAVSTHSNVDYPSATQPAFTLSCALCHDPHGDPENGSEAMLRTSIGGFAVNFARSEGEDSFDDGLDDGVHDSICVVCHTTTSHNNAFSTELRGQGHDPVGGDCMSCHEHGNDPLVRSGFMPGGSSGPGLVAPQDTATPTATETATPVAPTPTETPIPTDTPTMEPTATTAPTETPVPPSETPTPTATPTP